MTTAFGPQSTNYATTRPGTDAEVSAGVDTWFKNCSAPGQTDGTIPTASFLNIIVANIRDAVRDSGVALNQANDKMLYEAIVAIAKAQFSADRGLRVGTNGKVGMAIGEGSLATPAVVDATNDKVNLWDQDANDIKEVAVTKLLADSIVAGADISVSANAAGQLVVAYTGAGGTGPSGMSIIFGTGSPTAAVGNDGQFYRRTDGTGGLWGPKSAGAWPTNPMPGTFQELPADAAGSLTNDGTGTLAWSRRVHPIRDNTLAAPVTGFGSDDDSALVSNDAGTASKLYHKRAGIWVEDPTYSSGGLHRLHSRGSANDTIMTGLGTNTLRFTFPEQTNGLWKLVLNTQKAAAENPAGVAGYFVNTGGTRMVGGIYGAGGAFNIAMNGMFAGDRNRLTLSFANLTGSDFGTQVRPSVAGEDDTSYKTNFSGGGAASQHGLFGFNSYVAPQAVTAFEVEGAQLFTTCTYELWRYAPDVYFI